MREPPARVAPERLFRLLLRRPRPWLSVDLSIGGVSGGFRAFALPSEQDAAIFDEADAVPVEIRSHHLAAEITARALYLDDEPAFEDTEQLLRFQDADTVISATIQALSVVAPRFPPGNYNAWHRQLRLGARHPSNVNRASVLARCVDSMSGTPRPDLFFGGSLNDLTEGQWAAYWAAYKEHERK